MKYLVTTWDGHTYFVDTHVSASGYRAEDSEPAECPDNDRWIHELPHTREEHPKYRHHVLAKRHR